MSVMVLCFIRLQSGVLVAPRVLLGKKWLDGIAKHVTIPFLWDMKHAFIMSVIHVPDTLSNGV